MYLKLIGFAGKYRLFPCDSELYMVCERRNPSYPRPQPPVIKKLPTRRTSAVTDGDRNYFSGNKPSPSFGIETNYFSGNNPSPSFGIGTTDISTAKGGRGDHGYKPVSTLPRPVAPQGSLPVSTGKYTPVIPIRKDVTVPQVVVRKKNPFIQLHDKIEDIKKRRQLLYALTGQRLD